MLIVCAATLAHAQETAGGIAGRVLDPAGAAIPAAEVAAIHIDTGAVRKVQADPEGAYTFPALPIGRYRIEASQAGFKRGLREGLELHVNDRLTVNVQLQVGDVTQEVTVVAPAVQVETASSEQSGLVSGDQVRELQLNGRSFVTLLELVPGVSSDMPDRSDPNQIPYANINGARYTAGAVSVDGGSASDPLIGSGALNTATSIETIAEFKVLTSSFSAEFGRGGMSQVNVVTRGGTRQYHGALYHFFRNDALDARDYFSHLVLPLRLNNFGYNLSGPVRIGSYNRDRTKTFFFWNQEFNFINMRGTAVNTTVPSEAMRRGDFRELGPGRDGAWGTADDPVVDPTTGVGFPNAAIPASRIDPNARKLIELFPLPNFQGPGNINYTSAKASTQRVREDMIRIDHVLTPSWKVYGRFTQMKSDIRNPYGGNSTTSVTNRFPGIGATIADRPGRNVAVNMTNTYSPRLLSEFNFTRSGYTWSQRPAQELATRKGLGIDIPELFPGNEGDVIPAIGLGSAYAGLAVSRAGGTQVRNYDVSDNFTRIAGRHVFKAGALFSRGASDAVSASPFTNGSFSFTTILAKNQLANLLLGLPATYTEEERSVPSKARYQMFEGFVQDDFRATARLNLNLGLRYSAYWNPYDADNTLANFVPALFDPRRAPTINPSNGQRVPGTGDPLNGLILAGANSPYGRRVTNNNLDLLGPRFGFAWDVFGRGRTALRGGYGIYYNRPMIQTFIATSFDNPPFSRSVTIQQPSFSNPAGGQEAPAATPGLIALGLPLKAPTIHQWSLGIQQQLPSHAVLGVSYVASRGTHLIRRRQPEQLRTGCRRGAQGQRERRAPLPGLGRHQYARNYRRQQLPLAAGHRQPAHVRRPHLRRGLHVLEKHRHRLIGLRWHRHPARYAQHAPRTRPLGLRPPPHSQLQLHLGAAETRPRRPARAPGQRLAAFRHHASQFRQTVRCDGLPRHSGHRRRTESARRRYRRSPRPPHRRELV